jgi:hypothetical protein
MTAADQTETRQKQAATQSPVRESRRQMQAASQKAILLALGSQTQAEIAAAAQSRLKKIARFAGPRKGLDPSSASAAGAAGQSQTQSHSSGALSLYSFIALMEMSFTDDVFALP